MAGLPVYRRRHPPERLESGVWRYVLVDDEDMRRLRLDEHRWYARKRRGLGKRWEVFARVKDDAGHKHTVTLARLVMGVPYGDRTTIVGCMHGSFDCRKSALQVGVRSSPDCVEPEPERWRDLLDGTRAGELAALRFWHRCARQGRLPKGSILKWWRRALAAADWRPGLANPEPPRRVWGPGGPPPVVPPPPPPQGGWITQRRGGRAR